MEFEPLRQCFSSASCAVTQVMTGLVIALLMFLVASGLTLVFGVLRVTNFAHGTFYMMGGYSAYSVYGATESFAAAVVAAVAVTLAAGALFERFVVRRVKASDPLMVLLSCYGVILMVDDLAKIFWGPSAVSMGMPQSLRGPPLQFGGGVVPVYYLVLMAVAVLVGASCAYLVQRTAFGRAVQAVSERPQMAAALGLNTRFYYQAVIALGCALAGLAGALAVPMRAIVPGSGFSILIDSFVITVIGGMGSVPGALIAAMVLGMTRSIGSIAFPLFTEGITFVAMLLVLIFRPTGLISSERA